MSRDSRARPFPTASVISFQRTAGPLAGSSASQAEKASRVALARSRAVPWFTSRRCCIATSSPEVTAWAISTTMWSATTEADRGSREPIAAAADKQARAVDASSTTASTFIGFAPRVGCSSLHLSQQSDLPASRFRRCHGFGPTVLPPVHHCPIARFTITPSLARSSVQHVSLRPLHGGSDARAAGSVDEKSSRSPIHWRRLIGPSWTCPTETPRGKDTVVHCAAPPRPAVQATPAGWSERLEAIRTEPADRFSVASRSHAFGSARR